MIDRLEDFTSSDTQPSWSSNIILPRKFRALVASHQAQPPRVLCVTSFECSPALAAWLPVPLPQPCQVLRIRDKFDG